ncbi:MAG: glycosyltransferase family 39 protein [Candidatus Hydrogenedentes bacterium]|nr:glycosyltransferase family 39 protein [Candidatus Hydrogenedentota bacterium]
MGEHSAEGAAKRRHMATVGVTLAILLALAAYLRFYRLPDQGILGVDEGRYVLDALSARAELNVYAGLVRGKFGEMTGGAEFSLPAFLAQAHAGLSEQHPFAPKPGFACASAIAMKLTGNVIGACSYVEAVCGVLSVMIVFGFVRDLRNARSALIACALLAVSSYHIYFSRNAYPQCSAGALLLLGVWCHYRWFRTHQNMDRPTRWPWLVLSGVLFGLSFWFNYQIAGAFPAVALVHVLACAQTANVKTVARAFMGGSLVMLIGFVSVIAVAEAWTYPIIVLYRSYGLVYPHATFLELLAPRLIGQSGVEWNASGWPLLAYFISVTDGSLYATAIALPIAAACAHALYVSARRRNVRAVAHPAITYGVVPFAVIWAVFSFKTMQGARTFTSALPFLFAVTAISIDYALRVTARAPRYALVPAAGCALAGLFFQYPGRLHEVLTIRSAYPRVVQFAREQQPPSACAAWSAVLEAYGAAYGVETRSIYADSGEPTPPIFVSDWQELYNRRAPDFPFGLAPGAVPLASYKHEFGRVFLSIEAFPSFGNTWENIAWTQQLDVDANRKLLVYASRDIEHATAGQSH